MLLQDTNAVAIDQLIVFFFFLYYPTRCLNLRSLSNKRRLAAAAAAC